jgi:hypothetical protein
MPNVRRQGGKLSNEPTGFGGLIDAAIAVPAIAADDPSYSGVTVDESTNTLIIYRVNGRSNTAADSKIEARYHKLAPTGVRVSFRSALLSLADVKELDTIVESSLDEFAAAGYEPTHWGVGDGYCVYAVGSHGVESPPDSVRNRFGKYLDNGLVRFEPTGAVALPAPLERRPNAGD